MKYQRFFYPTKPLPPDYILTRRPATVSDEIAKKVALGLAEESIVTLSDASGGEPVAPHDIEARIHDLSPLSIGLPDLSIVISAATTPWRSQKLDRISQRISNRVAPIVSKLDPCVGRISVKLTRMSTFPI